MSDLKSVTTTAGFSKPASDALQRFFGSRFNTAQAVRDHHGRDESPYPLMSPDAVVHAHSTEEVSALMKLASAYRLPVIAYGAGSSVEGQILAIRGAYRWI